MHWPLKPKHKAKESKDEQKRIEKQIIEKLKTVYDPEIPVNIYDIGLIYEINIR